MYTAIRVMNTAWRWLTLINGHAQNRKCKLYIQIARKRISDSFSGINIQNNYQINKADQQMDLSYIGHPNLVDAIHSAVFDQVGTNHKIMIAIGILLFPGVKLTGSNVVTLA